MLKERTLEQVYRSAVSGLYARIRSYYDYLIRNFGEQGFKLIEAMSHEYGLQVAERARGTLENNDIDSVTSYLVRIFDTVTYGKNTVSVIKESKNKIIVKVTDCPLKLDDVRICRAHTTMEKTVVKQLNPDLNYYIGRSIPAGDQFCEHILELKESHEHSNHNLK